MSDIAIFHSSFGVTAGVSDAARRLESAGHRVHVVDQYAGRKFADYEAANAHVASLGFPRLIELAVEGVADLPDDLLVLGFSNGGGMATAVALQRPVSAVVLCSGALPVEMLGASAWPAGVPAQLHATVDDPRRPDGHVERVMRSVCEAEADAELVQYPGEGHLFTFPDLPDEHDPAATERFWTRVLAFCAAHSGDAGARTAARSRRS